MGTATGALWGCATGSLPASSAVTSSFESDAQLYQLADRITWGANASSVAELRRLGWPRYVDEQLHARAGSLPPQVQAEIDLLAASQPGIEQSVEMLEQRRKSAESLTGEEARIDARKAYQQEMNGYLRAARTRHLLRDLYSPNQVLEEMDWFWLNHFSVFAGKGNLRAMVGDYDESAIRPHALGKFGDLLRAVAHHPAMLRYLDNAQNAAGRINENYARELMELHTLGVDGGYTQADVQELARVLTGFGINARGAMPRLRADLQPLYVRQGLFEFNPNRHDFGPKTLLGEPIRSRGAAELDEALDRLARSPATARHISAKLAAYWLADDPPPALVARMAAEFQRSDGDIAQTLRLLFNAPEFARARKFKDPMRYVLSTVRLACDDKVIANAIPALNWLNRLGEPLFGRQTPDGYPLESRAWDSAGQLATRFEIAKALGSSSAALFRGEGAQAAPQRMFPQLAGSEFYNALRTSLSEPTRRALEQATSPQEWNTFLLSSPELMNR